LAETNTPIATSAQGTLAHPLARTLALTTLCAALTALGAQVAFRVPFMPVPVTLQVFFVLLSGAVLGSRRGAWSQLQYLALGAAGLPVFSGGQSGLTAFAGPTTGYLLGFVAMAWVVGRLTERAARPSWLRAFVAMLAGIAALYLPGTAWLSLWLHFTGMAGSDALSRAFLLGVTPFFAVDLVKAALAAGLATRLCRRSA
jgi:biotin transport system substrate-specific component